QFTHRRRGQVIDHANQAARVAEILVVARNAIEQIGLGVVVAGNGRGLGREDGPAAAVVLREPFPGVAAGHVLVDAQHHFPIVVGVDDVLIAVGQGLDRFALPAVVAVGVGAGGVAVGGAAQAGAAAGGGAASPGYRV